MANKKKSLTEDLEPPSLRRSSRTTRGSVQPRIEATKLEDVDDIETGIQDDVESDDDYSNTKSKRETRRRGSTAKREPAKRALRKSNVKNEVGELNDPVKSEPIDDIPGDLEDAKVEGDIYYELSEAELKDINHAFNMNRLSDEEELINADGLRTAIRSLGFEPRGDEIKKLLKSFGKKANKVNRDGFHKIMALKYGSSPGTRQNNLNDEISRVFNLLDLDKTGLITLENLKEISKELNEDLTESDLEEMISAADLDGDSKINKQEFQNIMVKTSLY